jgi:hypothetical protein
MIANNSKKEFFISSRKTHIDYEIEKKEREKKKKLRKLKIEHPNTYVSKFL